jgi:hypothetical protein
MDRPSGCDVIDNFNESLYSISDADLEHEYGSDVRFLGANESYSKHDFKNDWAYENPLNVDLIEQDMEAFRKHYKKEIDFLKARCESFEIKFGVITYFW